MKKIEIDFKVPTNVIDSSALSKEEIDRAVKFRLFQEISVELVDLLKDSIYQEKLDNIINYKLIFFVLPEKLACKVYSYIHDKAIKEGNEEAKELLIEIIKNF